MSNITLYDKIGMIIDKCGDDEKFFELKKRFYDDKLSYLLNSLKIFKEQEFYMISYKVQNYLGEIPGYILVYEDGKITFDPQRGDPNYFRVTGKVLNYIENDLFDDINKSEANSKKEKKVLVSEEEEYREVNNMLSNNLLDIKSIFKYFGGYASEDEKEELFKNGIYNDDNIEIKYYKENNEEFAERYEVYQYEVIPVLKITVYPTLKVDFELYRTGNWSWYIHGIAEEFRLKMDGIDLKVKKENLAKEKERLKKERDDILTRNLKKD